VKAQLGEKTNLFVDAFVKPTNCPADLWGSNSVLRPEVCLCV
jgi:hypothetical protein